MEAYEGMYKSAKIRVEYESAFKLKTSHIKLFINGNSQIQQNEPSKSF